MDGKRGVQKRCFVLRIWGGKEVKVKWDWKQFYHQGFPSPWPEKGIFPDVQTQSHRVKLYLQLLQLLHGSTACVYEGLKKIGGTNLKRKRVHCKLFTAQLLLYPEENPAAADVQIPIAWYKPQLMGRGEKKTGAIFLRGESENVFLPRQFVATVISIIVSVSVQAPSVSPLGVHGESLTKRKRKD